MLPNREEIRNKYIKYSDYCLAKIKDKYNNIPNNILIKKQHGIYMQKLVEDFTKSSKMLNESYFFSSSIEGCLHDIGRFPQFYLSGTLDDKQSQKHTGFKDHGEYGKYLLSKDSDKLLRYFLPYKSNYDFILKEVIGEHTNIRNKNYLYSITEFKNVFNNYSFDEVINSRKDDLINKLISLKLKILQEVDSLELLHNIMIGAWTPTLSSMEEDFITEELWNEFTHFKYINIAKFKERKTWTLNSSFLVRYGLLTHKVNFVGTLKEFKDSNSFDKIWDKSVEAVLKNGESKSTIDPLMIKGQEYIKQAVDNLIMCSDDGILITPQSRQKALVLTLNEWEKRN